MAKPGQPVGEDGSPQSPSLATYTTATEHQPDEVEGHVMTAQPTEDEEDQDRRGPHIAI